ncbi:hypothetical protein RBSH_05334 [Rhodopirellula baltica SH28]|uniref:Uncharacterized protein n=1 Tax=Rhodopirellula baltica SH28 TaxID=993517 RepID=K5D974_RHOBT|nr:hypothetical protein RBSH_05334 [Rhodopirellula baltica SH28]
MTTAPPCPAAEWGDWLVGGMRHQVCKIATIGGQNAGKRGRNLQSLNASFSRLAQRVQTLADAHPRKGFC